MKALIQRVKKANVTVDGRTTGEIGNGILVLLGVGKNDSDHSSDYIIEKVVNLRIFENKEGKMDLSLKDINGELLIVSQFTLYGSTIKGRRPDFTEAADPKNARLVYDNFINKCRNAGFKTQSGVFGAMMEVELINDGPVTFMIETK